MSDKKRETFSSGIGVFFATLGSAVGLGNIWKFPYLTGANGGAAFLIIYLLCVIFVGMPIMIAEFYIGRKTRKNIVGAVNQLSPNKAWGGIGILGMLSGYLILFFYTTVAGWVYSYIFKAMKGEFGKANIDGAKSAFSVAIKGPVSPIVWQLVVIIIICTILILGVKKGIERVTKSLMPVLLILVFICMVRALTLPGASQGISFLFKPDFGAVSPKIILIALGLAFFKLSVGMGTMTTYGSYFTEDNNMIATALRVTLADTLVSIMAGLAIFPAVFSFGMEPAQGPSLLFVTVPLVFSKIPLGNVLLTIFFVLTAIAATTASISIMEVPIAYFTEEKKISRNKAVIINGIIIAVVGILATLSASEGSALAGTKIFGKTFFDLFDYISSNIFMPIGGLLIAIFIGYFNSKKNVVDELSNGGVLANNGIINLFRIIIRYATPILVLIVFLNSIGIIKL